MSTRRKTGGRETPNHSIVGSSTTAKQHRLSDRQRSVGSHPSPPVVASDHDSRTPAARFTFKPYNPTFPCHVRKQRNKTYTVLKQLPGQNDGVVLMTTYMMKYILGTTDKIASIKATTKIGMTVEITTGK